MTEEPMEGGTLYTLEPGEKPPSVVVEVPYYNIAIAERVLGIPMSEIAAWMETKGYRHMPDHAGMIRGAR